MEQVGGSEDRGGESLSPHALTLPITEVRLTPVVSETGVVAIGSFTLGGCFVVHSVRVIQLPDGRVLVAMPQAKTDSPHARRGKLDVCHPISRTLREDINEAVMGAYADILEGLQGE